MKDYSWDEMWAYGLLENISTFIARIDMNTKGMARFKELYPQYCGTTTEGKATEAAIGQFVAQIEEINKHF